MPRLFPLLVILAAIAAPAALAEEPGEPPPEPAPPVEPAPAEPVPATIADGVTIAGVAVGGMTAEEASAAVQGAFDAPLRFAFKKRSWRALPADLGARTYVAGAVGRALGAPPGEAVTLVVAVSGRAVREYVAALDERFSRPARDARLRLEGQRPFITKAKPGVKVLRNAMIATIVRALKANDRAAIRLDVDVLEPAVTRASFGPVLVIQRESKRLLLYRGMRLVKKFGIATGQPSYPTPIGRFSIVVKAQNPWWYPPASDWAKGLQPVPPGPGNPLGTRWMGISAPLVGIHGTPDAASIGYSASHGCVRMRITDAEWLFGKVSVGTPVFILGV